MLRRSALILLASTSLLCAPACLLPLPPDPGKLWAERRLRAWDQLERLKSALRWRYDEPVEFEFDDGTVTVRGWWLEGGPGWEYVRARFTYKNTSEVPMASVAVQLAVLSASGEMITASRLRLRHPFGLPLHPGTMFSDEITVPTDGAHLRPDGWHWTMTVRGRPETDPDMIALH